MTSAQTLTRREAASSLGEVALAEGGGTIDETELRAHAQAMGLDGDALVASAARAPVRSLGRLTVSAVAGALLGAGLAYALGGNGDAGGSEARQQTSPPDLGAQQRAALHEAQARYARAPVTNERPGPQTLPTPRDPKPRHRLLSVSSGGRPGRTHVDDRPKPKPGFSHLSPLLIPLDGTATWAGAGGGGEWLAVHVAELHQVKIFTAQTQALRCAIKLEPGSHRVTVAGGEVLTMHPDTNELAVWSAADCKRQRAQIIAEGKVPKELAAGSGSPTRALIRLCPPPTSHDPCSWSQVRLQDLELTALNVDSGRAVGPWRRPEQRGVVEASPDGDAYAFLTAGVGVAVRVMAIDEERVRATSKSMSLRFAVPGVGGNIVYTSSGTWQVGWGSQAWEQQQPEGRMPGADGVGFVALEGKSFMPESLLDGPLRGPTRLRVLDPSGRRTLALIKYGLRESGKGSSDPAILPPSQRAFWFGKPQVLLAISPDRQSLQAYDID